MLNHLIHVHYDLFTKSVSIATGHTCCYRYPDFSTSMKHKPSFATFRLSLPISQFFFVFLVKISSDVTQYFSVSFHFLQLMERQASSKALNALYFKSVQKLITEIAVSFWYICNSLE